MFWTYRFSVFKRRRGEYLWDVFIYELQYSVYKKNLNPLKI